MRGWRSPLPHHATTIEAQKHAVPVEVRICPLGLVRIRHVRASRFAALAETLDRLSAENSDDESCVSYIRGYWLTPERCAVEFTTTLGEIGTRLFHAKMRQLERAVRSYLDVLPTA
jgi:hypothetical protein